MGRWIRFLTAIAIGAAAALYYGWKINPVKYTDTTPDTLRADYKSDYVLMVAEAYRVEGDLNLAARRLVLLGNETPLKIIEQAIDYAKAIQYQTEDLATMDALASAFRDWNPLQGGTQP